MQHRPLVCAVLVALSLSATCHAGDAASNRTVTIRYAIAELGGLGGTTSEGNSIDDIGLVTGFASLEGDAAWHATAWLYGLKADLGTLGGPNSNVAWPVKNTIGLIAGIAQTADPEPNGALWSCRSFFPLPQNTGYTCLGFAWEGGRMRPLGTLGGKNSFATGANDRREIAGWAETAVRDSARCVAPYQYLQFRPVIWGPQRDAIRALPLLAGDSSGAATALNDRGQVVGISGICDRAVGRFTARHAVLWENGRVVDIGSLGGVAWNTPTAINERGDVVGFSNVSAADGGGFHAHAFYWSRRTGMRDLGTLPGDYHSQALGMNDAGDVAGLSCDADFAVCRAVLWKDGVAIDLNTRRSSGYTNTLIDAQDVNDFGQITGQAYDAEANTFPGFRAIPYIAPSRPADAAVDLAFAPAVETAPLSVDARSQLMRRFGIEEGDLVR